MTPASEQVEGISIRRFDLAERGGMLGLIHLVRAVHLTTLSAFSNSKPNALSHRLIGSCIYIQTEVLHPENPPMPDSHFSLLVYSPAY